MDTVWGMVGICTGIEERDVRLTAPGSQQRGKSADEEY